MSLSLPFLLTFPRYAIFSPTDRHPFNFSGYRAESGMRSSHTRVIFGNLSYSVTQQELYDELSKHVTVVRVEIPCHRNNSPKGVGIVDVKTPEEADMLHSQFHKAELFGRRCYISFGDDDRFRREDRHRRRSRDRREESLPRRRRRSRDYSESDDSPPRRRSRNSSDSEDSPPRRRSRDSSDSDESPPHRSRDRRRRSPLPRRRRHASSSNSSD